MVVGLFHFHCVEDHLTNLCCELGSLQVRVLLQHGEDQVDTELQVQALVAHNPVHQGTEVTQQVALTEAQSDHEAGVEPDALEDDVVGNQVAHEVFLTLGGADVDGVLGHAADELHFEVFLACHGGNIDVGGVGLLAVNREGFENILEAHAVVGFFPHLLGEVEVCFWCVDVGVHTKGQSLVHQQLAGVEVAHQEGDGVTLFVRHLLEVSDVFTQLNFVGEPGVSNSLVVEVHCPLVFHRLKQQTFLYSLSKDSHCSSYL